MTSPISWRALASCVAMCTVCAWAADSPFSGIAQVAIKISDAARSDRYYREVLGFDRLPASPAGSAWYKVNDDQFIELLSGRADAADHHVAHFSLATADIRRATALLKSRGIQTTEILPGADGNLQCKLNDPDGNQVVVTQRVTGSLKDRSRGSLLTARRLSTRLRHVGIKVADLDIAASFYRDKLGLTVEEQERGTLRWINMQFPDGDYIQMQTGRENHTGKRLWSLEHFGLDVADAHATYETLIGRGVPRDGKFEPAVGYAGHLKINFMDPDDTMVELMELGTAKANERREP